MIPRKIAPVLVLLLAGVLPAQQAGGPNSNYLINGAGNQQSSFVTHSVCVPGIVVNDYSTQDPGAPVLWAYAPTGTIGWVTSPTNSVDIGPAGLAFVVDGTLSGTTTNSSGDYFNLVPTTAALDGITAYLAMAHIAATSPDGFRVSQTHRVTFYTGGSGNTLAPSSGTNSNPGATPVTLTDDSFAARTLNGGGFPFYGTTYNTLFVGSNGFVTFGSGDTAYFENPFTFSSGPPRIAVAWDDLNPAAGGSVTFYADPSGGFEVCFVGVPEFGTGGSNTFRLIAQAGASLQMDYDAGMTLTDGLVGVSPGGGGVVNPLDLSQPPPGGNPIAPGTGFYEQCDVNCSGSFDAADRVILTTLNGAGNPMTQS